MQDLIDVTILSSRQEISFRRHNDTGSCSNQGVYIIFLLTIKNKWLLLNKNNYLLPKGLYEYNLKLYIVNKTY